MVASGSSALVPWPLQLTANVRPICRGLSPIQPRLIRLLAPIASPVPAYCNFLNDVVSLQFAVTPGWQNQTTAGKAAAGRWNGK